MNTYRALLAILLLTITLFNASCSTETPEEPEPALIVPTEAAAILSSTPEPEPTFEEETAKPNILVNVSDRDSVEFNTELVLQNNCGGSAEVENDYEWTRTIDHSMKVEGEYSISAEGDVKLFGTGVGVGAEVAASLGYQYGTQEAIARSITVKAGPGTNMEHKISFREIYEKGSAAVELNGNLELIPFSFRSDFALELIESRDLGCPITEESTGTPTELPTQISTSEPTSSNTPMPEPTPTILVPTSTPPNTPEPQNPPSSVEDTSTIIGTDYFYQLDLNQYNLGDIPTDIGSDIVINERDGQKVISGLNQSGRFELKDIDLSSNFDLTFDADWNDTNVIISLRGDNGSEIRINFQDGITFGNTSSGYSSSVGWRSNRAVNSMVLRSNRGAVRLFINDDFFGSVPIDPNTKIVSLTFSGITQEDYLFSLSLQDTTTEVNERGPVGPLLVKNSNGDFYFDLTAYDIGDILYDNGSNIVLNEREGQAVISSLSSIGIMTFDDLSIGPDFEIVFDVDWNDTNASFLFRAGDGAELKFNFIDGINFGARSSSYSSSVGWKGNQAVNQLKVISNKQAIRFFVNDNFFTTIPNERAEPFTSLTISGINQSDALFSFNSRNTNNLNIVQDQNGTTLNEDGSDFYLNFEAYEMGDIPRDLGAELLISDREGQKILTSYTNNGQLILNNLNLSDNSDLLLDVDWNDTNAILSLISESGEDLAISFVDGIAYGGENSSYSTSVGWKGNDAINNLRLSIGDGSAKFFINETLFSAIPVPEGTTYNQLKITGITQEDAIFLLRGDSY